MVEAIFLVSEQFYPVGLDVLLHIITLNKSPESTQSVKNLASDLE